MCIVLNYCQELPCSASYAISNGQVIYQHNEIKFKSGESDIQIDNKQERVISK